MFGWLVNDRLTAIPGTRTFWNHLLDGIPGLVDKTAQPYSVLASVIESEILLGSPDYIIRNAAYFRWLKVECPVIAFVQDILEGVQRTMLLEACAAARLVVFNSDYTKSMYPELASTNNQIIPIGTDETIFKPCEPYENIPDGAVLWVGSGHFIKGFDLACELAHKSDRPWVFVMKDDTPVDVAARVFRRIAQPQLAAVASACAVGVCTSRQETQHLAGIEMGMCGLPLVTTNVGVYYDRVAGSWGQVTQGYWPKEIERVSKLSGSSAANYWRSHGFGLSRCIEAWANTVATLEDSHVVR